MSWKHWRENEISIYRNAMARDKSTKYFTQMEKEWFYGNTIHVWKGAWKCYYGISCMLSDENPMTVFDDIVPNEECTTNTREEEKVALKRKKNGKAMGPDALPVEVWKSFGEGRGWDSNCCWIRYRRLSSRKNVMNGGTV